MSRKRKKKKSGKPVQSRRPATLDVGGSAAVFGEQARGLAAALESLTARRNDLDTLRTARAAKVATELVADLVALVTAEPELIVEDELCRRLGSRLAEEEQDPMEGRPGPHHLAEAMVAAAEASVASALETTTDTWRAPWRVLTAGAGILPYPLREAADSAITRLRGAQGGRVLPAPPAGPALSGPVRWTRDRYGSRFAVTAAITTEGQPERWYLWDIDACGHEAFTVHSGFYPSEDAALTAWQAGVGPIAAAGTVLTEVDDPSLVDRLLSVEEDFLRSGGETEEQFAEYHRSKRLGEVVKQATRIHEPTTGPVDTAAVAREFTAWLRAHDAVPGHLTEDLDELAAELADSWSFNGVDAVYATCSPHRVALCVVHLRGYYLDEFADQLVALLPGWTRWLAARNGTPPELADRCLPYTQGEPHPQVTRADGGEPDYLARVIE